MKRVLIVFLVLFIAIGSKGQSLSLDSAFIDAQIPDTVTSSTSGTVDYPIQYSGGSPYTGTIYLVSGVDSSAGVIDIDTIGQKMVTNLMGFDTIKNVALDSFDVPHGYRYGGNVVVIWPIASGVSDIDTIGIGVFVVPYGVAVKENKRLYEMVSVYPNPSKDYIYFNYVDSKIQIERVKIYGLNGRLLYNKEYTDKIGIANFSKGIYIIEVDVGDGQTLQYKLIKD